MCTPSAGTGTCPESEPSLAEQALALARQAVDLVLRYPEVAFVLVLSLLLPVLRWVLEKAVYRPLAKWVLQPRLSKAQQRALADAACPTDASPQRRMEAEMDAEISAQRDAQRRAERVVKMCESFWKLTAYGSMLGLELAITHAEPWFWRPRDYWVGWPDQPELPLMRLLFGVQLAYYISTTFTLALWEVPRSDYWVMQTHHCCTVVLIYYNYISGYQRWGCLIMMLHDLNDVIMEVAKCLNYADQHTLANAAFALFVLAWAALRLTIFPFVLIRSTMLDSVKVLGYVPPHHGLLNCLLCVLCCFHVYWFGLILRVAYMTIRKGKGEDIREKED